MEAVAAGNGSRDWDLAEVGDSVHYHSLLALTSNNRLLIHLSEMATWTKPLARRTLRVSEANDIPTAGVCCG